MNQRYGCRYRCLQYSSAAAQMPQETSDMPPEDSRVWSRQHQIPELPGVGAFFTLANRPRHGCELTLSCCAAGQTGNVAGKIRIQQQDSVTDGVRLCTYREVGGELGDALLLGLQLAAQLLDFEFQDELQLLQLLRMDSRTQHGTRRPPHKLTSTQGTGHRASTGCFAGSPVKTLRACPFTVCIPHD